MDSKTLLAGVIGFMLGGLVVSTAASTIYQDDQANTAGMTMMQMSSQLTDKRGDAYDAAFITGMIQHHEGAVAMARQSESRAKHEEIKQLSRDIISAQEREIAEMKQWQKDWGYAAFGPASPHGH